jgi:hypothetical protein
MRCILLPWLFSSMNFSIQSSPEPTRIILYFFGGLFQIIRANLARRHISSLFFSLRITRETIQRYFKIIKPNIKNFNEPMRSAILELIIYQIFQDFVKYIHLIFYRFKHTITYKNHSCDQRTPCSKNGQTNYSV